VEEAAFLMAMQRIVGRIEIENDLLWRRVVGVEEELDEQPLDRRRIMANLVVTRGSRGRVLEPVQGALAGKRRAVCTLCLELAGERCQHRVMAQLIVVDQVFVAERDAEPPLGHHGRDGMLDLRLGTAVLEAGGKPSDQIDRAIGRPEQQRAGIRGHLTTVERRHHPAAFDPFIPEQVAATLCRHRGAPLRSDNSLSQKNYRRSGAPMHYPL
jgi:hypothetical protein